MTPETPQDPQQGKAAEDEQIEAEAAAAKEQAQALDAAEQAATADAADDAAEAGEQAPTDDADATAEAAEQAPAAEEGGADAARSSEKARKRPRMRRKVADSGDEKATAGAAGKKAPASARARGEKKAGSGAAAPAPAKPARRAARSGGKPVRRRVVRARARYVRTSARKARMVCVHLRGKTVPEARAILEFTPREVARDWRKLLDSAVANAESNHELLEDDLIVRDAYADEGPTIKRFRPRAMGRATPIHKRTSHLTITLTPGP
jgi:ribosomal protein L22